MAQATHGAVADGDQKSLGRHSGAGQHRNTGLLQGDTVQVQRRKLPLQTGHVAVHLGRLAQQHIHGHIDWQIGRLGGFGIAQHQLALLGGHPHHSKRATLALTQRAEQHQRIGGNRQHIALLAFIAPDLLGRHAAFLQRHSAQVKPRATAGVVGQLGEGVGQTAGAHIVDRQNGVALATGSAVLAQRPTLVDDLLRPALDFRVAALHRIKIKLGRIGASGHRARRAATHANAHAGPPQLNQQTAGRERHLVGLRGVNHAQPAGNHDRLVVAALRLMLWPAIVQTVVQRLLIFTEIPQQIRPPKLVVERRPTQRPIQHDLQGAGNVRRFPINWGQIPIVFRFCCVVFNWNLTPIDFGDGEAGQAGLGFGAAAGGAFVADFAAGAGGGTWERGDGGGVVVGFHLHQHVVGGLLFLVAGSSYFAGARGRLGHESFDLAAGHDGGVVGVSDQHVLRVGLVAVPNHAKQAVRLRYAVDGEGRIEDFVTAVLAVGLGEHHQLDVGRVALQLGKCLHQVVDLVGGQRQAKAGVGGLQRRPALPQHIDLRHRRGRHRSKQTVSGCALLHHALGHAVMQQVSQ